MLLWGSGMEEKTESEGYGEIVLFIDTQFGGAHIHIYKSVPDLKEVSVGGVDGPQGGNWNDKVSSFRVVSGTWKLYADANYQSPTPAGDEEREFWPGFYPRVEDLGIENDTISSVKFIHP